MERRRPGAFDGLEPRRLRSKSSNQRNPGCRTKPAKHKLCFNCFTVCWCGFLILDALTLENVEKLSLGYWKSVVANLCLSHELHLVSPPDKPLRRHFVHAHLKDLSGGGLHQLLSWASRQSLATHATHGGGGLVGTQLRWGDEKLGPGNRVETEIKFKIWFKGGWRITLHDNQGHLVTFSPCKYSFRK